VTRAYEEGAVVVDIVATRRVIVVIFAIAVILILMAILLESILDKHSKGDRVLPR